MDKNPIVRVSSAHEALRRMGELEELAASYPESRDGVIEIMERYSGEVRGERGKVFRDAAERIAAIDMLEILQGR